MGIIKSARQHTGLSQSAFGELLGTLARGRAITQSRISDYESGRVAPSQKVREVATPLAARELLKEMNNQPRSNWQSLIVDMMQ